MEDGIGEKKEDLSSLLDRARGPGRSYREYARAAGVSATAITRMRKGDYTPKPDTIAKLTSPEADPQGGVTYEEMMGAAGYTVSESDKVIEEREIAREIRNTRESGDNSDESIKLGLSQKRVEIREVLMQYDKDVTAQIYTSLVNKGIVFKLTDDIPAKPSRKDLYIRLFEQPITNWMFDYIYCDDRGLGVNVSRIHMMLGRALLTGYEGDTKLSYVVNGSRLYQYLQRYEHRLPFKGELSVILFDQRSGILLEEFYLSNYVEGDMTKEVYLA